MSYILVTNPPRKQFMQFAKMHAHLIILPTRASPIFMRFVVRRNPQNLLHSCPNVCSTLIRRLLSALLYLDCEGVSPEVFLYPVVMYMLRWYARSAKTR